MATSTITKQYVTNYTMQSYTPSFSWQNSASGLTVANIDFHYTKTGGLIVLSGRFNITALGSPGNTNLEISLPSVISQSGNYGVGAWGVIHGSSSDSSIGQKLVARVGLNKITLVYGPGGNYSSSIIGTGYYTLFAVVPTF